MSTEETRVSLKLMAVQAALESGDTAALTSFWQNAAEHGTPLVEPIAGDDKNFLVSFVCRKPDDVKIIALAGQLSGQGHLQQPLALLPGSDVWYRTLQFPASLRGEYRIAYDGVELPDPLNPQQQVFPAGEDSFVAGDKDFYISLLTLPAAPPQPWLSPRPGVAPGRLEHLRFHSDILGNEHMLSVYTPAGFQPNAGPYPLVILFDRWAYAEVMSAPTTLDNLIASGAIPPLVAVMISHVNFDVRERELSCNPSYVEFLAQEVMPWARQQYRATDDPARTVVSGMSLGGLIAAYTGLRHPEIFGKILCQSASFQWRPDGDPVTQWLTRQFAASPRLLLSFYMEAGSLEDVFDEHWGVTLPAANRHMRDVLQSKGYPVHYAEFSGGHVFVCWQGTLADGLIALLGS